MILREDVARPARIALCVTLIGLAIPNPARAGDPDELVEIAPRPAGSSVIALASMNGGNGLVYSRDGGETFSALCSRMASAVIETSRGPQTTYLSSFETLIVTHDDRVLVGTPNGLWQDDGKGCSWELLPEMRAFVSSLVHDPIDPTIIYGATETGGGADNGIFRRNADGTFDILGEKAPRPIHSLKVVELPDGGRRFYKLFARGYALFDVDTGEEVELTDAGAPTQKLKNLTLYSLAYSDDEGEAWTEHEIEPDLEGGSLSIEAVDPTDPDRLVISVQYWKAGGAPDTLLVSDDRGATRRAWHTVLEIGSVTFTPDGQVWIADAGEGSVDKTRGLWHAASTDEEPELITDAYKANCAEWRDGKLEVCGHDRYGVADLETGEIEPSFTSGTLATAHVCDDMDVALTCRQSFCTGRCKHWYQAPFCVEQYQATLESCGSAVNAGSDGGVTSGGAGGMSSDATGGMTGTRTPEPAADDAGATPAASESGGCSCRAAGRADRPSTPGLIASALLLFLIAARRISRGSPRGLCSSFGRAR